MIKSFGKHQILVIILILIGCALIALPTFSRFNNSYLPDSINVWDGSIADTFSSGSGTEVDPYIISEADEFAYFITSLEDDNYVDDFIELDNDIVLNSGTFNYENGVSTYLLDGVTYYIKEYTNELYLDSSLTESASITLNMLPSNVKFKGHFNGNGNSIYGNYISSNTEGVSLFSELSGVFKNVFLENSLTVGQSNVSGLSVDGSNLVLENVYTDGYVVTSLISNVTSEDLESIVFNTGEEQSTTLSFPSTGDVVDEKLSGVYEVSHADDLNNLLTINGNVILTGNFEVAIDQGNPVVNISVGNDTNPRVVQLNNLVHTIVTRNTTASGLLINSDNVNIRTTVNTIDVVNASNGSGFINNVSNSLKIEDSYNTGSIKGNYVSSGIINTISNSNDVVINNVYNSGVISSLNSSGIINTLSNSNIVINNTFNTSDVYFINNIDNSIVDGVNNLSTLKLVNIGTMDSLSTVDVDSLIDSEYLNTLGYVNRSDQGLWITDRGVLPELYYTNELYLVDIDSSVGTWSTYNYLPDVVYSKSDLNIHFSSDAILYNVSSIEYYVSSGEVPLTLNELDSISDWSTYNTPINVSDSTYIVYGKITDNTGSVSYINSSIIKIDLVSPSGSISYGESIWNTNSNELDKININETYLVSVSGTDYESGILSTSYYVSSSIMSNEELDNINEWTIYEDDFSIVPVGEKIIYVKFIDNALNETIINSDILVFMGYGISDTSVGLSKMYTDVTDINITDKSSVNMTFDYERNSTEFIDNTKHVISTDSYIPLNTLIVLKDNVNNKLYEYLVNSSYVLIVPFTSFTLVGGNSNYVESSYVVNESVRESFSVTFDFSRTNISANYSFIPKIELLDSEDNVVRSMIDSEMKSINLYTNSNAVTELSSSTVDASIRYNSDSVTEVNFKVLLSNSSYYDTLVLDSTMEDMDYVVSFGITDLLGNYVDRSMLRNFIFKVDDTMYYPNDEGRVIIKLSGGIMDKNIDIYSYTTDDFIPIGDYLIKMDAYTSYSLVNEGGASSVSIPLTVSEDAYINNFNFSANMSDENIIIERDNEYEDVLLNAFLENASDPNIRVSLYKKSEFNGVNQDYELVDLNEYITNDLESVSTNVYFVPGQSFNLKFETSLLEVNGYKFLLEAYDGSRKLGKLEKFFVVK